MQGKAAATQCQALLHRIFMNRAQLKEPSPPELPPNQLFLQHNSFPLNRILFALQQLSSARKQYPVPSSYPQNTLTMPEAELPLQQTQCHPAHHSSLNQILKPQVVKSLQKTKIPFPPVMQANKEETGQSALEESEVPIAMANKADQKQVDIKSEQRDKNCREVQATQSSVQTHDRVPPNEKKAVIACKPKTRSHTRKKIKIVEISDDQETGQSAETESKLLQAAAYRYRIPDVVLKVGCIYEELKSGKVQQHPRAEVACRPPHPPNSLAQRQLTTRLRKELAKREVIYLL